MTIGSIALLENLGKTALLHSDDYFSTHVSRMLFGRVLAAILPFWPRFGRDLAAFCPVLPRFCPIWPPRPHWHPSSYKPPVMGVNNFYFFLSVPSPCGMAG